MLNCGFFEILKMRFQMRLKHPEVQTSPGEAQTSVVQRSTGAA
jgi:hypothetical protein